MPVRESPKTYLARLQDIIHQRSVTLADVWRRVPRGIRLVIDGGGAALDDARALAYWSHCVREAELTGYRTVTIQISDDYVWTSYDPYNLTKLRHQLTELRLQEAAAEPQTKTTKRRRRQL